MAALLKKIISSFTILTLILGGIVYSPITASAQLGTIEESPLLTTAAFDTSFLLPTINTSLLGIAGTSIETAGASTGHFLEQVYQWAKDVLVQSLKKALLGYLTDRVVAYIQGDSNGGIVGDWQSYLSGVAVSELQLFGKKIAGVDICSPFSAQIKLAFRLPPVQKFGYKITCTFNDLQMNIKDFMSNFESGGNASWLAYDKLWEPSNNGYGVFLTASIDQAVAVMAATESAKNEAQSGNGFLDKKECDEATLASPAESENPYALDFYSNYATDMSLGRDIDGDGKPGDIPSTCKVLTPGTLVAQAVKKAAVDADFDFVLAGEDLAPYVAAIADAMVGRVLTEGLALIAPSADTNNIGNYVDTGAMERSEGQQFRNHRTRLSNRVNEALKSREFAQLTIENASLSWLKNMNGEEDPAKAALDQVLIAKQALLYTHREMSKVSLTSQLKNRNNPSCELVQSLNKIQNVALPRIRNMISLATELAETLEVAHDDLPELDPDFENPCQSSSEQLSDANDVTCQDNLDQIAILKHAQDFISTVLIENTPETRQILLDLNALVGDDAVSAARAFRTDIRKVDDNLAKLFRATSEHASRLRACFVPRNPADPTQPIAPGTQGVVIPWLYPLDDGNEEYEKPARPFPWEKSDTASQNIDPNDSNSTPDQAEQAPATTNP